jgi:predicted O-methyltransferase YrrM
MYSPFTSGFKYLKYWLTAKNGKGHGIHSPFVFDFVTLVLNDTGNYYCYPPIEEERQRLLNDQTELNILDLGAGSRKGKQNKRCVREIAKNALKPVKYSQLLFRLANYYKSENILELGTSLGITTAYLSLANHAAHVITLEGVPDIAVQAKKTFSNLGIKNVSLVEGNFDDTLLQALHSLKKVDFAYIDGNHRLEPTLRYFETLYPFLHEHSIVVFDDIHWSSEMELAWNTIIADSRVTLTIDLFFLGVAFFKKEFKVKQHFAIRF